MSAAAEPTHALRTPAELPSPEEVLGQAGSENFTVASLLLGREHRRHLRAIYGYARLVDDVGDEAAGDRGALLDAVAAELDAIYSGRAPEHPLMAELAATATACGLPEEPLRRLLEANRVDQVVTRYETFEALLDYCALSATPVGELVLHVFAAATPERIALSDRICAGLQVLEHLQDVAEDHARGRVYLPLEDLRRFGCPEEALAGPPRSEAHRALMLFEAGRALRLLDEGAPLAATLPPRPRIAVAGFTAGGRAALRALEEWVRAGAPPLADGAPARRRGPFAWAFARAVVGR